MDRITSMTAFATVVASGSFAGAAQRLNMSPAMITNHVRALEEHLGARLLNRTTRKLSLTEAGKAYLDQASRILAEIEAADASVGDLQATPRGRLHVNAATILTAAVVPLFDAFGCAYPEITLELVGTDRMPDLVEDGIDVAVRFNPSPQSSLIVRQLGSFHVIACASFAYLATRGEPREPADLSAHNCLSYAFPGFSTLTREWRLRSAKGEVSVPISGNLHTNNTDLLRAAALTGRGIVLAPTYRVEDDIRAGRLVHVLRDWNLGEMPIVALYPNRDHLPARVRVFIDFAVKHFAEKLKLGSEPKIAAAG
ncbi:MAG TPA: LysR substrate-binding domain-containing protein [Stellaceae bacterium]|nr:LysR substrate-binding domain-containing protein [Stellaceae bacterium]